MNAHGLGLIVLASALVVACGGQRVTQGLNEPVRVSGAQFRSGALPGVPPLSDEELQAGASYVNPHVTAAQLTNLVVFQSQRDIELRGRTSRDGVAVGVRFADLGSGYWVLPVSSPDPLNDGEYTWSAKLDLSGDVPSGFHALYLAAIDGQAHAGTQRALNLCVGSAIPDNLNGCDPTSAPPAVVVSLSWDSDVDLDLRVVAPSGKVIDSKHPSTAVRGDGGVNVQDPGTGVLDRDANAACSAGPRLENLTWKDRPALGRYLVYANLFDACGAQAVRFRLAIYDARAGAEPGTFQLEKTFERAGELLAADANGGAKPGLFVTQFDVD